MHSNGTHDGHSHLYPSECNGLLIHGLTAIVKNCYIENSFITVKYHCTY